MDGQYPGGRDGPALKELPPVQGQADIAQIDVHHHLVPAQSRRRGLCVEVQHGVDPALKGGQDVAGALPHPQQQQGLQGPFPVHNEPQVRVAAVHHALDKVLWQGQHGGHLSGPKGLQGVRLRHPPKLAVLGDVLHLPHISLQQSRGLVPLGGGDGQGHPGEVHPLGEKLTRRPARPQGQKGAQKDKPRQQPALLAEAVQGQLQEKSKITDRFHPPIRA